MENVSSPKIMRQILDKYNLAPLKKFGQNFLIDDNVLNRIADSVEYNGGCVLEIGPGLGALTAKLSKRAKKVLAYEIDTGLFHALEETLQGAENIVIKNEDILKADLKKDTQDEFGGESFAIAANLPYYITSACIMRFLEEKLDFTGMTLMMQKEVAQRLCAAPGNGDYGAITAAVNFFAEPKILFDVSKNCFYPKPDVDSTVIRLSKIEYDEEIRDSYLQFVKALFSMRRKTVLNNLVHTMHYGRETAVRLLEEAGIAEQRRAETLGKEDFTRLARAGLRIPPDSL